MKIKVDYFDNVLHLENDNIIAIEIENRNYFYRFVKDLYTISKSEFSDEINFFDDENKEINVGNKIKVYLDFFDFNLESKKYINDISKYINENTSEVDKNALVTQYNKLVKIYNRILNNIELPLSIVNEFNVENITKIFKVRIDNKQTLLDKLLLLIDIENVLKTNNILFFINLKQYLTKNELLEFYKYSIYNQIKIVLIDSQSYGTTLNYEKKLIIDEDLEEIMI